MEAKRGAAADTKRQRELDVFVYGVLQEQRGPLQSFTSAASGFERLTVCLCAAAHSLHTFARTHRQSECAGGGGGWAEENVQNKNLFSFCFPLKHSFRGLRILDRDVQSLAWHDNVHLSPLRVAQRRPCRRWRIKTCGRKRARDAAATLPSEA